MFTTKQTGGRMKDSSELGTIVGNDAILEGKLTVKHAVRIDGQLNGELNSSDTITVGSTGRVEGTLTGENIVVGGQVDGTLKSNNLLTLEAGSRFTGDLEAARLIIIDGAIFSGRSTMGSPSTSKVESLPRKIQLTPEADVEKTE